MITRFKNGAGLIACALALALPAVVHAQANDAARARASMNAAAAARFDAALAAAARAQVPTESLVDKALEGVAKRVSSDRIAAAVEHRLDLLVRARAALQPDGRAPRAQVAAEISAVADALQRGVDEDAVRRLRESAPPDEPISTAVHVLADLVQRGVPADVALDVLAAWRARGNGAADLAEVPANIDRLVRQGMRPAQAGATLAATLRGRLHLGNPGRGRGGPPPDRDGPPPLPLP